MTTRFEKVPISIWKVSGKPVTIDEFIEEGRGSVDATGFRAAVRLWSLNGRLWQKLESINAKEYPPFARTGPGDHSSLGIARGMASKRPVTALVGGCFRGAIPSEKIRLNRRSPAGDWSGG